MVLIATFLIGLITLYIGVFVYAMHRGRHRSIRGDDRNAKRRASWELPFIIGSELWYRAGESSLFIQLIRQALIVLDGEKESLKSSQQFLQKILIYVYVLSFAGCFLAILSGGDLAIAVVNWVVAVLIPFVMYKQLTNQVHRRRRRILLELPIVLNKIVLLLNAGETLQRALFVAASQEGDTDHPLYAEFITLLRHLDNRMSFAQGLEEFARRCAVHEVSLFSNAILLNFKRGGDQLAESLRSLSSQLWTSRKALARTLGEEASSKLVVPMVLIFLVVMVIVASPALLYLN